MEGFRAWVGPRFVVSAFGTLGAGLRVLGSASKKTAWRFMGNYNWGYKSYNRGYNCSYPTYNPTLQLTLNLQVGFRISNTASATLPTLPLRRSDHGCGYSRRRLLQIIRAPILALSCSPPFLRGFMLVGLMYVFGIGVSVNFGGFIPEPGGWDPPHLNTKKGNCCSVRPGFRLVLGLMGLRLREG